MTASRSDRLTISDAPTDAEIARIHEELDGFNREASDDRIHFPGETEPGLVLNLAVRGPAGDIVGGLGTSSVLGVMWLEVLWTHEAHRGRGVASWLILEAEWIAHEKGCVGAGTWTFDWQGADFYPRIGFELNGIYDGYPFGMTEHVLSKRLPSPAHVREAVEQRTERNRRFGYELVAEPTRDEMRVAHRGLHEYCVARVGEGQACEGEAVRLALRDASGCLVGGVVASTPIRVLALEEVWIDEPYRGRGHGRRLLEEAERIAKAQGCVAAQGCCLSFQSPGFFHEAGYESFGRVDVYPNDVWDDLLIKRF
jgi:GNAT superfamily N-acetyltransferase